MDKVEFMAGLPLDSTTHRTKGDGSSKVTLDIPEIYLEKAQYIVREFREKVLRITVEVVED